jgi:hypothetical protein
VKRAQAWIMGMAWWRDWWPGRTQANASRRGGECKMLLIFGSDQAGIGCGSYVDAPMPKGCCDGRGDMFVQMKTNGHLSGCFLQTFLAQYSH